VGGGGASTPVGRALGSQASSYRGGSGMRRFAALAGALAVVVAALTTGTASSTTRSPIDGLRAPAHVVRDRFGVPHVIARNDHDVFFLQGWVHAQDRLFQMDLTRRQASGTRAELLGPDYLADDIQNRTIGLRRAAERSLEVGSDEGLAAVEAYSEGVNAWVRDNPLPSEYAEVEVTQFEPWTPLDSAAIGKAIAFSLSFDIDIFTSFNHNGYVAAGEAGGFDGDALYYEDANRIQPFSDASTVPDALAVEPPPPPDRPAGAPASPAVEAASRWTSEMRELPSYHQLYDPARFDEQGSNEWGVTGDVSASGRPMIANDPHLALDLPSTFAPIGLQTTDMFVMGSGFAGVPSVILGHNRDIAWGATTNPMDVTDSYTEQVVDDPASPSGLSTVYQGQNEHVVAVPEEFRVNTIGDGSSDDVDVVPAGTPVEGSQLGPVPERTLVVPRRNNGPLILGQFSIQFTGFSGTRELDTFLTWNRAKNLDDFREGLQYFDFGSQNWAYTDRAGNVAYFASGESPLREDLQAGAVQGNPPWLLREGTGGNEWLPDPDPDPGQAIPYQVLPADEMPQVVNPPSGFFVNANNDPAGTTLDNDPLNQQRPGGGIYYLNPAYDGYRAGRITERLRAELAGDGTLSFADMQDIQADVGLLDAETFVPAILAAYDRGAPAVAALTSDPRVAEAVERLRTWDLAARTGIPEGYDAVDVDGQLSGPTDEEVASSIATTIYSVWRGQFLANTIDATLAPLSVATAGDDQALSSLRHLLETFDATHGVGASGLDFFAAGGGGAAAPEDRRDTVLLQSLVDALDALAGPDFADAFGGSTDQDDYRWGILHRITFEHPLGGERNAPPAGGLTTPAPLEGIATDGGFNTVDASSHNGRADAADEFDFGGGPVRRFVGEARPDRIRAVSSVPGGASGLVESPWYTNLLGPWLTNEAFPQELGYRSFVEGAAEIAYYRPA
jgi:penicillin amidase